MRFEAELTDTFGGDANYSWVRRATFEAPATASNRSLLRRAKAALGTHYPMRTTVDYGDMLRADVMGACMCMFVIPAREEI